MPRLITQRSFRTQLLLLGGGCAALAAGGALATLRLFFPSAGPPAHDLFQRFAIGAATGAVVGISVMGVAIGRFLRPLNQLRARMARISRGDLNTGPGDPAPNRDLRQLQHAFDQMASTLRAAQTANEQSQQSLASRTQTVNRLLEFSLTIQGAGKSEQVFSTLSHFLVTELSLAGLTIVGNEPETNPPLSVKAIWPPGMESTERPIAEMDAGLCPCLRQGQPRHFPPHSATVRCAIDTCMSGCANQPAFCIPFHIGQRLQALVHMLLPAEETWTESRRQLAQTYVNAAQSALVSLQLLADAEKQSMTDALTGLYNRRSLEQLLEREVALSTRHARPLALVMIDMDRFKEVNDSHGHAAGDHLLRSFADCVRITLRKTDLAFRYGGDEFVIALPQTTVAQAEQVVQKLRQAFASVDFSSAIARLDQQPTLSVGVAERSAATHVQTLAQLLSAVDQALYDAKSANRNCVRVYEPPRAA